MRGARLVVVRVGVALLTALLAGLLVGAGRAAASAPAGDWVWPVGGSHAVLRPFAPPAERYGAGHRGVDLAAGPGRVVAAGAGRVSYAGLLAGRGVVVVVHGALRTTYEPVAAAVRIGQQVQAGDLLGAVEGSHAGCARPCLHWGVLRGQTYLDPLSLVHRGPSRLLPVPAPGAGGPQVGPPALRPATGGPATLRLEPAAEPRWALRSARDEAVAGLAVLALLLGLALLVRRSAPPDPAAPALAQRVAPGGGRADQPPAPAGVRADATVVDLTAHRVRRRA